jgi:hypothetical protein
MTVAELKLFEDRAVVLHLLDGEILTVNVMFVDGEYEDIIVDILSTNQPEVYKVSLNSSAFTIAVGDILSVQELT